MVKNRYNIVNEETNQIICKAKTGGRHYRQNKDAIQDGLSPVSTTAGRAYNEVCMLNAEYGPGWCVVPDPANSAFVDSPVEAAFGYCSALKEVTLPESLTTIDDEAFCLCSALKKVVIHENTINIAPTAFKYAKNAVIYCQAKSYAAQYAQEHNIPVQYI